MLSRLRSSPTTATLVVALAMFTDSLVFSLLVPILPSYLDRLGATQAAVGLLFAIFAVALLLATPLMGMLCDRIGYRVPMLVGLFGLGITTLSFAFLESYWALLFVRAVQGVASAATATAGLALLAAAYPAEKRGQAIGLAMAGNAKGTLLGPPAGGLLFDWGGHQAPFLVAAGLALLDGVGRLVLITPPATPRETQLSARRILGIPAVMEVLTLVVLGACGLTLLEANLPLHLTTHLALPPLTIGLIFAVSTIAFGVASPIVGALSDRWGRLRVSYLGLALTAACLPLVVMQDSVALEFVTMAAVGIAVGIAITPTMPALTEIIDKEGGAGAYGIPSSMFNMAWALGMIGGPVAGSALAQSVGLKTALLVISGLLMSFVIGKRLLARGIPASRLPPT